MGFKRGVAPFVHFIEGLDIQIYIFNR